LRQYIKSYFMYLLICEAIFIAGLLITTSFY